MKRTQFELEIDGKLENIPVIADFIATAMRQLGIEEGIPAVQTAVDEACTNIIKHAYKGVEDGRDEKITISAECYSEENLYLKINITDNGIGMTSHELSQIRDISFTKGGTGEGVERVCKLIEHNLGKVEYQSEKGQGTTVSINLPLKIRKEI